MMRIIAGTHRSRRLEVPAPEPGVRPTTDKVREALFSMLLHTLGSFQEVVVADVFCGSGAGALEALSRGAQQAFLIDSNSQILALARRNAVSLGEQEKCTFMRANALQPPPAPQPCHLLLLDPPYGQNLAAPALSALTTQGWAAAGALATVELGRADSFDCPAGWQILKERVHGPARIVILERATA